jgi:phosphate transport system protein
MTQKKDEAIAGVVAEFEKIANLVFQQMDHLENIMTSGHIDISDEIYDLVKCYEKEVDKREVKLSEKVVNTIVLYHPVASELRKLMACYRAVISLERISDHVLIIFDQVRRIKTPEVYEKLQEVLHNMTFHGNEMVKKALLSFLNEDREFAIWTLKNEVVFDESNHKIMRKILKKSGDDGSKHLLASIISVKEIMSNIERIADHATNIAEASIYCLEGMEIRHHKLAE